MKLTIIPIYAAFLGLLFFALSAQVIFARRRARVGLGDGGDRGLVRAMRVHANFAEYVPLTLVLLAFLEIEGAPRLLVHLGGLGLLAGRLAHAYGMSQEPDIERLRAFGIVATFTVLVGAALALLYVAFAPY
jgi:uncharacterized membrane protein YecN with MAPEG domain